MKELNKFQLIVFFMISITLILSLIINSKLENDLENIKSINEKNIEEIDSLKTENERLNMVADDWYTMWEEERESNYWLYEFYYSNVCSIEEDSEQCKSGVYE